MNASPFLSDDLPLSVFIWALGALAVWLFARRHFDTPGYPVRNTLNVDDVVFPPQYLTSRLRYRLGRVIYILGMELQFVVIALLFPWIGRELVPLLPGEFNRLDPDVAIVAQVLLSAMLFTAFLPNIGPVAALETRMRVWLHRICRIPEEARHLSERLERAAIAPGGGAPTRVGADGDDSSPTPSLSRTIGGRWNRALSVRAAIQDWATHNARVAAYMESRESGWLLIEESVQSLESLVDLHQQGRLSDQPGMEEGLERGLDRLLYRLHRFLSCALLNFEPTQGQRAARMRALGFDLDRVEVLAWDQVAFMLGGLALWTFLVTSLMALVLHLSGRAEAMGETLIPLDGVRGSVEWTLVAFLLYGTATLSVLMMRRVLRRRGRWPIPERPLERSERPWLVYVGMGLVGLAIGLVLLGGAALLTAGPSQPWWATLIGITAGLLAYHLDGHPETVRPNVQMLVQGAVTGAAAYVCSMVFLDIPGWMPAGENAIFVGFLTLQAALTAGFIGRWIPARYREFVYAGVQPQAAAAGSGAPAVA